MEKRLIKDEVKYLASYAAAVYSRLTTVTHEFGHYLTAYIFGKNPTMVVNADETGYVDHESGSKLEDFMITLDGPLANILGGSYLIYKGLKEENTIYFGFGVAMVTRDISYQLQSLLNPSGMTDYNKLSAQIGVNVPLIALSFTSLAAFFSVFAAYKHQPKIVEK